MSRSSRLFFIASLVHGEMEANVLSLQHEMCQRFDVCHNLKSPPHVTLIPPFRLDELRIPLLKRISAYPPMSIEPTIWGVDHFDDRVIYIKVGAHDHLIRWRDELYEQLRQAAFPVREIPNFHPHITIGSRLKPRQFTQAWPFFKDYYPPGAALLSEPRLLCHDGQRWVLDVLDV